MSKSKYTINVFSVKTLLDGSFNVSARIDAPLAVNRDWSYESKTGERIFDENSLFYQIAAHKVGLRYPGNKEKSQMELRKIRRNDAEIATFITNDLIFLQFDDVYNEKGEVRDAMHVELVKRLFKAGIIIELNEEPIHYVFFEKSGGMSRNKTLSFIRKEYRDALHERILMGVPLDSQTFVLSKLFAYNGLMLSDGKRIENVKRKDKDPVTFNEQSVVLVDDIIKYQKATYITAFTSKTLESEVQEIVNLMYSENRKDYPELRRKLEQSGITKDYEDLSIATFDNFVTELLNRRKRILRNHLEVYFDENPAKFPQNLSMERYKYIDEAIEYALKKHNTAIINATQRTTLAGTILMAVYHELNLDEYHRKLNPKLKAEQWRLVRIRDGIRALNLFDGIGLVSPHFAKQLNDEYSKVVDGKPMQHTSFQIRMPYIKGMLHEVDFQRFAKEKGITTITDYFGIERDLSKVEMIITVSQFKALGWLRKYYSTKMPAATKAQITRNGKADLMAYYFEHFNKYDHALYIIMANRILTKEHNYTKVNYQFLSTVDMDRRDFLAMLEPSIEHYVKLRTYPETQKNLFTATVPLSDFADDFDEDESPTMFEYSFYQKAEYLLDKNINALSLKALRQTINNAVKAQLNDYSVGQIRVAGENRYLSGDLLFFLYFIFGLEKTFNMRNFRQANAKEKAFLESIHLSNQHFYAPKIGKTAQFKHDELYVLLRNPHIIRNENGLLRAWAKSDPNNERVRYLGHLKGVVMVNPFLLISERLGGADYDGDQVKIISDERYIKAVSKQYYIRNNRISPRPGNEPVVIPSTSAKDLAFTEDNVRKSISDTFSDRVGLFSNTAFKYADACYNKHNKIKDTNVTDAFLQQYLITIGLEIDAAKSGDKPTEPDRKNIDNIFKKNKITPLTKSNATHFITFKNQQNVEKMRFRTRARRSNLTNRQIVNEYLNNSETSNVTLLPYLFQTVIPAMYRENVNNFGKEYDVLFAFIEKYKTKYKTDDGPQKIFAFEDEIPFRAYFEKHPSTDKTKLTELYSLLDAYSDIRTKFNHYNLGNYNYTNNPIDENIASIFFLQYGEKYYSLINEFAEYLAEFSDAEINELLELLAHHDWGYLDYTDIAKKSTILQKVVKTDHQLSETLETYLANFKFKGARLLFLLAKKAKRLQIRDSMLEEDETLHGTTSYKVMQKLLRALSYANYSEIESMYVEEFFTHYRNLPLAIYLKMVQSESTLTLTKLQQTFRFFAESIAVYYRNKYKLPESDAAKVNEARNNVLTRAANLLGESYDENLLILLLDEYDLAKTSAKYFGLEIDFSDTELTHLKKALLNLVLEALKYRFIPEDITTLFIQSDLELKNNYFTTLQPHLRAGYEAKLAKRPFDEPLESLNTATHELICNIFAGDTVEALKYFYYLTINTRSAQIVNQKYLFDLLFFELHEQMESEH